MMPDSGEKGGGRDKSCTDDEDDLKETNGHGVSRRGGEMRKAAVLTLALLFGLFLAANAIAADMASKDECVAKTKEAAKLFNEKGQDEAIKEINNKQGKFVWKDTYVFMTDLDGKMLAHPMSPALVGTNVLGMKDKGDPGKLLFKEFVEVAKGKGEGWVDYMWTNPGDPKPRKKITYIYRVPGKNALVGAGIYE
jgi:signal transduction histidine kinase